VSLVPGARPAAGAAGGGSVRVPDQPKSSRHFWLVLDGERSEVCRKDPGHEPDLVVEAESMALAEWHLGRVRWGDALRDDRIRVAGPRRLARMLPTWNRRSAFAEVEPLRAPASTGRSSRAV
jgi:hypothetical protein